MSERTGTDMESTVTSRTCVNRPLCCVKRSCRLRFRKPLPVRTRCSKLASDVKQLTIRSFSDNDTIRFLELYRMEHVLYNPTLDEYRDRDKRAAAAKQELKKISESETSGKSTDEFYKPKVPWFMKINSFIRPYLQQRYSIKFALCLTGYCHVNRTNSVFDNNQWRLVDIELRGAAYKNKPSNLLYLKISSMRLILSLPSKETLRGHSDSSFRGEGYIQCCVGVRLCDMYSNQELAEVHFMYGKADDNAALASRLYQERYPQR
ncbi:hypothetical protein ANN_28245 [Periplaneta americana]|uniref:Uncharacterized protein n=1 Tax=Periplaneta americana TaxID=6978 RepID=A0ABQ8RUF7_PERAM|nr:hypothetical protein ANN_28245 [Periplaneta americana]